MPHGFSTRSIHAGQKPDPSTGAITTPIYATSTYVQESPGVHQGYMYARGQNPTRFAYEACAADLEGGAAGFAFASGLAACAAVVDLLPAGSHIIACDDLFGGTVRLFDKIRGPASGLEVTYADISTPENIQTLIRPNTRMIWVETPTNPMLKIFDLDMIAAAARTNKLISVCDNTFASPYLQRPLEHGFDIVLHSATKYLNGHSDIIGGLVVTTAGEFAEKMKFIQNAAGAIAGPFESFLVLRGIKTLAVRMDRHCSNAMAVAQFLESHKGVESVIYPGLPSHPQHGTALKQMRRGFGGMISAEIAGGLEKTRRFLERLQIFSLAESLGGVESLIEHPAIMTHASLPADKRREVGITDGLVRISVGIEDQADLIDDLKNALL
ncbi:MAG: PLP-dependent transferase [Spirochaetia bacterium]|nr:PLP-dependent transferase [Spirochaetia bacterium]